jgi:phenylalanyl-tRNA synthetase beta chain
MKLDLAWIRDHLEGAAGADELATRLTAAGMNVELREPNGDGETWDIDIGANRPDAMNHRGIAREAAAAGCGALRPLASEVSEGAVPVGDLARLTVEDPLGCPRYCLRVVRGVKVGPSPSWLARRLESCGIRPINNVVDATNYVLLDVGQPLHAFDLHRLEGREIRVRRARPGERMTTLDGVERSFDGADLLICDARRPVAIAGVMGGADSEISVTTTDVVLESAQFEPRSVRRSARRIGLKTEASHRFERGTDRAMARTAVDLVAALIVRVAGGEVAAGALDSAAEFPEPRRISFSLARLGAFVGCPIERDEVLRILAALGVAPESSGDLVTCTVPSFRGDLELAEDLYEEVLRHWGYDRVPAVLPPAAGGPGERLGSWPTTERARNALVAAGFAEAFTYAFVPVEWDAAGVDDPLAGAGAAIGLTNPLSARMAVMRRSLVPGLADAASGNLRRGATRVALGEVGRVFFSGPPGTREQERLGVVMAGTVGGWDGERPVDFLDLKGSVETILAQLGVRETTWRTATSPLLAPGEGAEVVANGKLIGLAGRLSDERAVTFDAPAPLWIAQVDLACAQTAPVPAVRPVPRFPAVTVDLTVRHPLALAYDELVAGIRGATSDLVESISPVVRYRGEGVGPDEVKTTLRLVYRSADRSLTQEEVNAAHFTLMERLAARLGVSFL